MPRSAACLTAIVLPLVVPALVLRKEGAGMVLDMDMDSDLDLDDPGATAGSTMSSDPLFRNMTNHTAPSWPDSWLHAHEHGKMIAHLLDEDTLISFLHAGAGQYDAETLPLPDFHLPGVKMQHAMPGFRPRDAEQATRVTNFPSFLALASSWDKHLVFEVALAVAEEFKTLGANVMLGPPINIHRNTQHEQEFDTLSGEDPTLGSVLVRSWILASQTHGIMSIPKSLGKAEQAPVHLENSVANITSWDIYYPPFETAIDCGAAGVMCANHEVNGLWACRDKEMLERDLKGIMGFHGMVIADNRSAHDYFSYASSFEKGLDMALDEPSMVEKSDHMISGMRRAAERSIAAIWHMRLEDDHSCEVGHCEEQLKSVATSEEHLQTSMKAAGSAIVLLRNEYSLLPLSKSRVWEDGTIVKRIGVFGPASKKTWHNEDFETPFHAIKKRGQEKGYTVVAEHGDNDVCVVMCMSETHWELDWASERALHEAINKCPKIVVFMELSGSVVVSWRHHVHAIATIYHAGREIALSWVTTLFGDTTPSGKLPLGFPDYEEEVKSWWTEPRPSYWDYSRFAYVFGHGLSFASFAYTEVKEKPRCRFPVCVMVTVTNRSPQFSGAEVVQAYFVFPSKYNHPAVLRGFHKTKVLRPFESEKVFFPFTFRDVSLYQDINNHTEKEKSWHPVEEVTVLFGSSSVDIRGELTVRPRGLRRLSV